VLVAGEDRGRSLEARRRGVLLTVEFDGGELLSAVWGFDGDVGVARRL
jgi:hypothetical protein